jgi:N-6 DNA Methylase
MPPSGLAIAGRRHRAEFGDFQTPPALADAVCRALHDERPTTIIEPTCGTGAFLAAAVSHCTQSRSALGMDINPEHLAAARRLLAKVAPASAVRCRLQVADFFQTDWQQVIGRCEQPILILGNPPWVTSSALGVLQGENCPRKENFQGYAGLEAVLGKSNFDVSEWMLIRLLEAARGRRVTVAMLCKTAVARRVLLHAWKNDLPVGESVLRRIDALAHFGARVDACLFVCRPGAGTATATCRVFDDLETTCPSGEFGRRDGRLVADVSAYERVRQFAGGDHRWRSGVKHDCARVFELRQAGSCWRNGFGRRIAIEPNYVFPLLKGGQVAAGDAASPMRGILMPQRRVGEETSAIARRAPKTWRYLVRHAELLDRRASSIYRNHPRFAVFGVGPYTFSRWKVVVSGLSKNWRFAAVGPCKGRPVVCDDTCYILPCDSACQARMRAELLNGERAREFFSAFVFLDSKRPLTAEILGLLDLDRLAAEGPCGRSALSCKSRG